MLAHAEIRCIGKRKASGRVNCRKIAGTLPLGTFTQILPPSYFGRKKGTKTKRMVGNYVKLNKRIKNHAIFLPSIETGGKTHQEKIEVKKGYAIWISASLTNTKGTRINQSYHLHRKISKVDLYAFWLEWRHWDILRNGGAPLRNGETYLQATISTDLKLLLGRIPSRRSPCPSK